MGIDLLLLLLLSTVSETENFQLFEQVHLASKQSSSGRTVKRLTCGNSTTASIQAHMRPQREQLAVEHPVEH